MTASHLTGTEALALRIVIVYAVWMAVIMALCIIILAAWAARQVIPGKEEDQGVYSGADDPPQGPEARPGSRDHGGPGR